MASVAPACPKAEGLSPASSRTRCCSHRARGRLQTARGVGSSVKPTAWPRVAAVGSCPTPWPERETAGKEDSAWGTRELLDKRTEKRLEN